MTTAQVVETSVTVNNNSPIQGYVHPDDQTQPTYFYIIIIIIIILIIIIIIYPKKQNLICLLSSFDLHIKSTFFWVMTYVSFFLHEAREISKSTFKLDTMAIITWEQNRWK